MSEKLFAMKFATVYPLYVKKAERKNRFLAVVSIRSTGLLPENIVGVKPMVAGVFIDGSVVIVALVAQAKILSLF